MIKKLLFMGFFGALLVLPFAQKAYAYSPYLSANWEGSNNVRININSSQPYSSVDVFYRVQDSQMWSVVSNLGSTDGNGYYSGMVDLGVPSWSQVSLYAKIGGDQTSTTNLGNGNNNGCWGNNCGNSGITFSQTNPSLTIGQNLSVNIYGTNSYWVNNSNYYISSNSNTNVVSASISGSALVLYANTSGSASIQVCQYNQSYTCGTLYVTVSGSSYNNITFSQTSPSVNVGESMSVSIFGSNNYYSNNYYISSNSNSGAVSASISGSTLNLYGNASGNATITVCQNNYSSNCGSVYVTVSGYSYGNITFSDANPYLTVGQSKYVSIYGNYGNNPSYYISSNSNSGAVSASISGSNLYLYSNYSGSATIIVCRSGASYSCGTVYASSTGSGSTSVYLNPSSVTVNVGQTVISYASLNGVYSGNLYVSSNSNSNIATASFSGSTISVYGQNPGTTTMNICYTSGGQCAYLYVTVTGSCTGWNCGSGYMAFSTNSLSQPTVGQYYSQQLAVTGSTGIVTYTIQSGSLPAGLILSLSGQVYGTPQNTTSGYFSVRASDASGRTAIQNFTLTPSGNVLGALLFSNGTLIKENGTVYITYKNTKTGFTSRTAFEGLGFKFSNVSNVLSSGLSDSGYAVWTSASSHPWGSWIKSGNTVYFVHESGLIPVSSYDVFLNNGGQDYLVVRANYYDFQLPMLSAMEFGDYRMK